ncbi:MAG: sporulation protein YqfD [Clostridia bacterium]|nr:sporulation protein YqfD [Clostridia bacterium]
MFLIKLTNFLYGYIEFRAEGGFPERFINLCSVNEIFVWDIRHEKDYFLGCMGIDDYKKIKNIAQKSGTKIRVEKKVGLPFFINKNKHRSALMIAGFVFFLMLGFFSRFIWTVEVEGNVNIPEEDIIEAFEELGVKPGKIKNKINFSAVSDEALMKIEGISWATVNINGCNAKIEIKEKTKKPEISEEVNIPTNIIANESGIIKRIDLYKGTKCVGVGTAVEKGDVLVTGAVQNKDTTYSFYPSEAYINAETKRNITIKIEEEKTNRVYRKIKKRYFVSFFSIEFPINFLFLKDSNYDYYKGSSFLEMDKKKLPVGLWCEYFSVYENEKKSTDKKFAELCACQEFNDEFHRMFSDKKIITEKVFEKNNSIVGDYMCVESIGKEVEMDIDFQKGENENNGQ